MSRQRRAARRRRYTQTYTDIGKVELPGPLRILTHPKVFAAVGIVFALAIFGGLLYGALGRSTSNSSSTKQANEAADVAQQDANATPLPAVTPTTKRFDAAPPMAVDTSKKYTATIKTTQGDVVISLDPKQAPEAVNSFVFLAQQHYYDNTPFMELVKNTDGSRFVVNAGDPTASGIGTPGYSVKKEDTTLPFDKGAVGMGGTSPNSNGGQFFISYGNYPALNGKYTIFGQVISGMDVLDKLSLLQPGQPDSGSKPDQILSVDISES